MSSDPYVKELTSTLSSYALNGIFSALTDGKKLTMPGLPRMSFSLSEIQQAADQFPDEQMRIRMQLRIGLAPFISLSQRERNEQFARTCGQAKWSGVSRSEQDRPLQLLAFWLLNSSDMPPQAHREPIYTPYNRWDVLEYEVRNVMPEGDHGTAIQTHWRRIRSKVSGLTEFRITQNANWASGQMPTYKMLTGGECRLENVHQTNDGDKPGFRFDLVVELESLEIDEEADIRWIREYEYLPGDLGRPDDDGSMVIASIVQVRHAVMSVKFSRSLMPSEVWVIANVPNQDRTVTPKQREVIAPKNGLVTREFFDLPVGYASGIGWRWGEKAVTPE